MTLCTSLERRYALGVIGASGTMEYSRVEAQQASPLNMHAFMSVCKFVRMFCPPVSLSACLAGWLSMRLFGYMVVYMVDTEIVWYQELVLWSDRFD